MKHKKLVTLALATSFLATAAAAPVWANDQLLIAPAPSVQEHAATDAAQEIEEQVMNWMLTMGTVKEVINNENADETVAAILVESNEQEYEFYLADTTWLVDGSGFPTTAEGLLGKTVVVAHSEAMTFSLPPKSSAMAVMVYDSVLPNYAIIEEVTKNEDGSVTVATDNGDRLVTIAADAQVSPFKTRNIVTLNDLQQGDAVVLYYDVLAPSLPAQASTGKVVQLAAAVQTEPVVDAEQNPAVEMVNLREAAAALGMQIDWIGDSRTVVLSKDAFSASIVIGSEDYGINRMRVKAAMAAEIRDGRTFVSSDVVAALQEALQ